MFKRKFVRQENSKDCGAACLLMMMRHYGGNYPLEQLREMMKLDKKGITAFNLIETAKKVGFDAKGYRCDDWQQIKYPCIAHVIMNKTYHHFVVVEKINPQNETITIADPATGLKKYSVNEFNQIWTHIIITLYPIRKIDNINVFKSTKKTLCQIVKPYRKLFLLILLLSIIYTVLNIISTLYFKIIIDNTKLTFQLYWYLFCFFLVISIIRCVTDWGRNKISLYINQKIDKSLMSETFRHLLSLPWQYFDSRMTGDIISRINDLSHVREFISRSVIIVLLDLVLVTGSLIVMLKINYHLFVITILMSIIYFMVVYFFNRVVKKFIIIGQESEAMVSSSLVEIIGGIRTIKNLDLGKEAYNKVMKEYNELVDNNYTFDRKYNTINTLKDFIASGGLLFTMFLGSVLISGYLLSLGNFVMFYFFLNFFIEPMKNIFDVEPILLSSSNALIRISEFFNIESDEVNYDEKILTGNISFNNVSFAYAGDNNVLNNLNFSIASGEKLMITGSSGAGKSTLFKLLMRYLDVKPNQIMIDNIDILNYSASTVRHNICYVSQDEIIFTDSLYNNIVLKRNVCSEIVHEVMNIACIDEIVKRHHLDEYMLLEENGCNLSGGEKECILIARALLKRSQIYIFDESMSEMNISLERRIINNIFKNYADKTIIVISHRLDNADLYDRVLSLNK